MSIQHIYTGIWTFFCSYIFQPFVILLRNEVVILDVLNRKRSQIPFSCLIGHFQVLEPLGGYPMWYAKPDVIDKTA